VRCCGSDNKVAPPRSTSRYTQRDLDALWSRCDLWELNRAVCDLAALAAHVVPGRALRTLDALHLATFFLARRRIEGLELLTADERLKDVASAV